MRFLQKYLGLVISLLVVLAGVFQQYLFKGSQNFAVVIAIILAIGVIYNHILTVWSPLKALKEIKEQRWEELVA